MSGLVSSIGKVFTPIVKGVSTMLGSGVKAVGSALFTGAAATGAPSLASGGLSSIFGKFGGGSTLRSMFSGAAKVASFPMGGLSGAAQTGLSAAAGLTPSGFAPSGAAGDLVSQTSSAVSATAPTTGGGFLDFLKSDTAGNIIGGIGKGLGQYAQVQAQAEENALDRDLVRERDQNIRDSYEVPDEVYHHGTTPAVQPAAMPTQPQKPTKQRYQYVRGQGVTMVPVTG